MCYGPYKGPQSQARFGLVKSSEPRHHIVKAAVLDDCKQGAPQRRPRMAAVVGFTFVAAATLNFAEGCESTARVLLEEVEYCLMVGLVIGYENCLHMIS